MGENDQSQCHYVLLNIYASLNHCISLRRALRMKRENFQLLHGWNNFKVQNKTPKDVSHIPSLTLYDCFIWKWSLWKLAREPAFLWEAVFFSIMLSACFQYRFIACSHLKNKFTYYLGITWNYFLWCNAF